MKSFYSSTHLEIHEETVRLILRILNQRPRSNKRIIPLTFWFLSVSFWVQVHKKIKRHMCPKCGSSFGQSGTLTRHILTVHEKRRDYQCLEASCLKRFSSAWSLKVHIVSFPNIVRVSPDDESLTSNVLFVRNLSKTYTTRWDLTLAECQAALEPSEICGIDVNTKRTCTGLELTTLINCLTSIPESPTQRKVCFLQRTGVVTRRCLIRFYPLLLIIVLLRTWIVMINWLFSNSNYTISSQQINKLNSLCISEERAINRTFLSWNCLCSQDDLHAIMEK